jgi:hypothetical protein
MSLLLFKTSFLRAYVFLFNPMVLLKDHQVTKKIRMNRLMQRQFPQRQEKKETLVSLLH